MSNSLQGVSSALIARNESWVRQQAGAMMRRVPSNVEKADLIQVGLIAVAQAAQAFEWPGDHDSEAGREAFLRFARLRVKGAMIDELRQMDHLVRSDRRKIKVIQIARERWSALHGRSPTLAELSAACDMPVDDIARLEQTAQEARTESTSHDEDAYDGPLRPEPATPADEVEARVDTAIVLRRLATFFAKLPERERQVIDAYLGIGLSPRELADELRVTPSRVSQLYRSACDTIAQQLGHAEQRAIGRHDTVRATPLEVLVQQRERELAATGRAGAWGALVEKALTAPDSHFGAAAKR